jgi:glycosyltransferase involved in cell wall biosynthesis
MSHLSLDVIVPCYNYGHFLRQCTQSVLQEQRLQIRILIIDDASTDGSVREARAIAAEDSRVQVIAHGANQGHIATFNEGIAWIEASYMLLLSADDMVAPGALWRAVMAMEAHPDIAFTCGQAIRFSKLAELRQLAPAGEAGPVKITPGLDFIRGLCANPINPVETVTAVVRSSVQKRVGGYCPALPHAGDMEMWLRCAAEGAVGELDAVQGFARMHGHNMRNAYYGPQIIADYRQRYDAFSYFFGKHRELDGAAELQRQAFASLAGQLVWEASCALDHGRPYAELIAFARELWPGVRRTRPYLKVAAKRMLHELRGGGDRDVAPRAGGGPGAGERPVISLIVCTRNRGALLAACLASLRQIDSSTAWELVIVDNGSTDETWALLSDFAPPPGVRMRLLREPRTGLAQARNTGVRAASGEILCFTDDDCYPRPDLIDSVARVFEENDIGFMGGQVLLHDPNDEPVSITSRTGRALFPAGELITTGDIQGACMAFRREVFDKTGLFDTAFGAGAPLRGAEDCEMVARASFAGWNGGFFIEPVVSHHHRRRAQGARQITRSYDYSRGALFAKLLIKHPRHRWGVLKNWYWNTPLFRRPSPRTVAKLWRELRGACRYAISYSWWTHGRPV